MASGIWNRARQMARQQSGLDFILVIDEVQKIGNWSETVKKEWDMDTFEDRNLKLVLIGSSSLLIQKA